jgi:hypothetical protein
MNCNGAPGLRAVPLRSKLQMLILYFGATYAKRLRCRETASGPMSSDATGSLRGSAEANAAIRQRLPLVQEPEENTIWLPSEVQAAV